MRVRRLFSVTRAYRLLQRPETRLSAERQNGPARSRLTAEPLGDAITRPQVRRLEAKRTTRLTADRLPVIDTAI